jgi:hypothetical protein
LPSELKKSYGFLKAEAENFLKSLPDIVWENGAEEGPADSNFAYSWKGTKDGQPIVATLWGDNHWLTIQTQADVEAS